jgi:hypothetical protein
MKTVELTITERITIAVQVPESVEDFETLNVDRGAVQGVTVATFTHPDIEGFLPVTVLNHETLEVNGPQEV